MSLHVCISALVDGLDDSLERRIESKQAAAKSPYRESADALASRLAAMPCERHSGGK
jgi:hypothetical protein